MTKMNRRDYLMSMGATAGALAAASTLDLSAQEQRAPEESAPTTSTIEDRRRRMKWWHEAKFGMFIHWGLYSVVGRHEWVMEMEEFPSKSMRHWRNSLGRSQIRRARGPGWRNARA